MPVPMVLGNTDRALASCHFSPMGEAMGLQRISGAPIEAEHGAQDVASQHGGKKMTGWGGRQKVSLKGATSWMSTPAS